MIIDYHAKFKESVVNIGEIGEAYSLAKAKSWQAQELKHSILASIINKLDGPMTQRENVARASDDYKAFLSETAKAIQEELSLKARYEKEKARFEALRSLISLEKHAKDNV